MVCRVELDPAAVRELGKLDPPNARRLLSFLHSRVAVLDDPRSIGDDMQYHCIDGASP
jgi:mRNA interferase RelE/StbE